MSQQGLSHIATFRISATFSVKMQQFHVGIAFGFIAYVIWGCSAIYWKQLTSIPAMQLLCHRIVWAFPIAVAVLYVNSVARTTWTAARTWSVLRFYMLSGTLLGVNLFVSIWATNAGYIVEMSLGYFMSPLVSVFLGVVVLREKLRLWQWAAVILAVCGVATVTFLYGKFPWIALVLAFDFGFYALMAKKAPLKSIQGIAIEFAYLSVPCWIYLFVEEGRGVGAFGHTGVGNDFLMVGLGVLTISPQLLFTTAIKHIPMTIMGLLQFIGPTLNVLVGIFLYHEPFEATKAVGFAQVWAGLVIYTMDTFLAPRKSLEQPVDRPHGDAEAHDDSTGTCSTRDRNPWHAAPPPTPPSGQALEMAASNESFRTLQDTSHV
ncbi:protein RarD [Aphanomyces invadans]|uniref:Protein RarD n=1 Tax=Aphanomyces invadans TaxID=157072 RepID=A0A024TVQ4_9STRA|nr:protein RarD [Aphanomyces invadans]ETV98245.1 protein RarD [Aphanomyces invadans]|eukprot:XP_008873120.1 protein RarD [Aphanomyces invadans]